MNVPKPFQKPSRAPLHSHRGGALGVALVAYKRAWNAVLGPVLDSILEFEREQLLKALADRMDAVMQVLDRRQGALEADLLALTERVRRLERDTGLRDEVQLTNQALLENQERLLALRDEIDAVREGLSKTFSEKPQDPSVSRRKSP